MRKVAEPSKELIGLVGPFTKLARTMSRRHNVEIVPTGHATKTDGLRIFIPFTSDFLPASTRAVLHGKLDHEVAHVIEEQEALEHGRSSPMKMLKRERNKTIRFLFNVFEDIRIERKQSAKYPGVAENLRAHRDYYVEAMKKDPKKWSNFWHRLGTAVIFEGGGVTVDWLDEPIQAYLKELSDILDRARAGIRDAETSMALARELYERVGSAHKAAEPPKRSEALAPSSDDDDADEGEDEDGDAESDEGAPAEGEGEPVPVEDDEDDLDEESDGGEPGGGSEAGDDDEEAAEDDHDETEPKSAPAADEDEDEDEEPAPESDGAPAAGGSPDDGPPEEAEPELPPAPGEGDDADDSDDEEAPPIGGGSPGDDEGDADSEAGEREEPVSSRAPSEGWPEPEPEPEPEDEHKKALRSVDPTKDADLEDPESAGAEELDRAVAADASRYKRYIPDPRSKERDRWLPAPVLPPVKDHKGRITYVGGVEHVAQIRAEMAKTTGALRTKMLMALQSQARSRVVGGLDSGRLDDSTLAEVRTGNTRVFQDVFPGIAVDTAIEHVVDLSGSMRGNKDPDCASYYALRACVALAEAWHSLRVPNEFIGFHNDFGRHPRGWDATRFGESLTGFVERSPFDYLIFKGWDESLPSCRGRFASIFGRSENADGEAVWAGAQRLAARPERRKILLVLSDGAPADVCSITALEKHLSDVVARIASSGIEVIGCGMGTDVVKRFYNKKNGAENLVVNDFAKLPGELFNLAFRKMMDRRSA